jgi:mRNA interferase RelE/StbE
VARYGIEFIPSADRQLRKLARPVQKRISEAIEGLAEEPRPSGVERIAGSNDMWRIRVGNYRVVYMIEDDRLVVLVVRLGPRRSVYRGL